MRYRRRLRSRIIISFALFGLGLTALFAAATLYMRTQLEDQLINTTLQRELKNFVDFKRDHPEPDARSVWDRFGFWTALAVLLILAAYAYPLYELLSLERFGSPGFRVF